ncbi:uncharacterized protein LOC126836981 [Adelges cooleyi]|uniref:uncharacterized protein LOC126836981 n=1 Tax=Adelges cooleyi TaxID=133065 RepID=UPI00217FA993|nr:uncharacterized protein LOC126836981 [Adelges cooleyi]
MDNDRVIRLAYSTIDVMDWVNFFEEVKIQDSDYLIRSADDSLLQQVKNELIRRRWSPNCVDDIVSKYNESNWPFGISSKFYDVEKKEYRIKNYICRRIPGFLKGNREEAVLVLAIYNIHMPLSTIFEPGFVMFLKPGGLYYIDHSSYGLDQSLEIVEVLRWDLLIMSPDGSLLEVVDHILRHKRCTRGVADAIIGKYDEKSWPSGIRGTQLQNDQKKARLVDYNCRRVPGILSSNQEEAVIVFSSDNEHMPADMIAKPGFTMIFKQGGLPPIIDDVESD